MDTGFISILKSSDLGIQTKYVERPKAKKKSLLSVLFHVSITARSVFKYRIAKDVTLLGNLLDN